MIKEDIFGSDGVSSLGSLDDSESDFLNNEQDFYDGNADGDDDDVDASPLSNMR